MVYQCLGTLDHFPAVNKKADRDTEKTVQCTKCLCSRAEARPLLEEQEQLPESNHLVMIQPQVHLRLPCYDF